MAGEHLSTNGYTPLPQSISSTDTEDDDEHLTLPNQTLQRESEDTTMIGSLYNNSQFKPLDETQNVSNRIRNGQTSFGYCSDNIPMMVLDAEGHDLWKPHDLSSLGRIFLVFSILLCILTTLIFLYVLPCDDSLVCADASTPKSSLSWEKILEGVELQGPISIVSRNPSNLIFLFRGQRFGKTNSQLAGQQILPDGGGVLSIQGTNGMLLWWIIRKRVPTDINCHALDIDGLEKPDCIVVGEQGLLDSINSTTGVIQWRSTTRTYQKLPVVLPDVDLDGTNDLLSVDVSAESNMKLVLISGKDGSLLKTHPISACHDVQLYGLDSNFSVPYFCRSTTGKETGQSVSLEELLPNVKLSRVQKKLGLASKSTFKNSVSLNKRKEAWDLSPNHRLHVKNQGVCPGEHCQVSVNVTVLKLNETFVIWHYIRSGTFVSIPVILSQTDESVKTEGCILKFWHWLAPDAEQHALSETGIVKRTVTERVLMIFINGSDFRAINASQSEVMQFCRKGDCQPNLELQTRSISIVDLDGDGSSELISYQSSYDSENPEVLTSKVQVVKLNAAL
ncbi:uncharacterized protein LOC117166961 [Belonocnema kinseyi]|uniref:uncharacterized protein LOC117166961 n=1 Tax=Belonocnema kinseyi TaxID=2817044 RepID=UPI00143D2275|nr:uncharacterized protein LOC117166961 [Belonocnema kinseyi]